MQVINLISWRLIPVSLLFIFNMNVFSCEKLSYYNELSKYVANYPDVQKSYLDLQRTRETLARNLSFNYFQQESSKAFFNECYFDQKLKLRFSMEMNKRLFERLSSSNSKLTQNLFQKVSSNESLFIFQAMFEEDINHNRKAEYHRLIGAMHYVIDRIEPTELTFHIIHELLHKYDEEVLYNSSKEFSDPEITKYLYELSQQSNDLSTFNLEDQELIKRYVLSGLKRGFLAEFKVWSATYRIYKEMKSYGEIETISWVKDILNQKPKSQSYLDFMFDYYQPRFKRPKRESLFHWDLFQNAYDIVMKELEDTQNKCDLLDDLKVFITECS